MLIIIAKGVIRPDRREAFIAAAREQIVETRKEPGCIAYDLHGSVSDPDTFVFVERWESHDHLAAHRLTPHLKAWRALSGPFKASPTAIEVIIGGEVQKLTS